MDPFNTLWDEHQETLETLERLKNTLMEVYLHFHCGDETYSDAEITTRVHDDLCNTLGSEKVDEFVDARIPAETPLQEPLYDDSVAEQLRKKYAKNK